MRLRVGEARNLVGYNLASLRLVTRIASERKTAFPSANSTQPDDIWAGLGVGSDVAAALEGRPNKR